jgi:hypothetical protein
MIYFISTNDVPDYPIKIGVTGVNFRKRFQTFQTTCPYRLEPIAIVEGDPAIEGVLHDEFAADRLMGEWYRRTDRLMGTIDLLADDAMRTDALLGIVTEGMTYKDRRREGLLLAMAAPGYKKGGHPATIKAAEITKLKAEGLGATEIAKRLGIGRASVYRLAA